MTMNKITLTLAVAATGLLVSPLAGAWTKATQNFYSASEPKKTVQSSNKSFSDPAFGYQAWTHFGSWGNFSAVKGKTYQIIIDNPQYIGGASPVPAEGFFPAVTVFFQPIGTPENPYNYSDSTGSHQLTNLAPLEWTPDHNFFPLNDYVETGASQQHIQSSGGGGASTPYGCTDSATLKCATVTRKLTDTTGKEIAITAKTTEFWKSAKRDLAAFKDSSGAAFPGAAPVLADDGTSEIGQPRMIHVVAAFDNDGSGKGSKGWAGLTASPRLLKISDKVPGKLIIKFKAPESGNYKFYTGGMMPEGPAATPEQNGKGKFTVDVLVKGL